MLLWASKFESSSELHGEVNTFGDTIYFAVDGTSVKIHILLIYFINIFTLLMIFFYFINFINIFTLLMNNIIVSLY